MIRWRVLRTPADSDRCGAGRRSGAQTLEEKKAKKDAEKAAKKAEKDAERERKKAQKVQARGCWWKRWAKAKEEMKRVALTTGYPLAIVLPTQVYPS